MSQLLRSLLLIGLTLLIPACSPVFPQVQTELSVTIQYNVIQPSVWRVPTGSTITLHISNQDPSAHTLVILFRTSTLVSGPDVEANTYWSHSIPAGQNETLQFTSPAAAGNYLVFSRENLDDGPHAKMTVVNVNEVQSISP